MKEAAQATRRVKIIFRYSFTLHLFDVLSTKQRRLLPCQGVVACARIVCEADQLSLGEECSRALAQKPEEELIEPIQFLFGESAAPRHNTEVCGHALNKGSCRF
jgi:hypothetical protein